MNDDIDAVVEEAAKAAYERFYDGSLSWNNEPDWMQEPWRQVAKAVILAVSQYEVRA